MFDPARMPVVPNRNEGLSKNFSFWTVSLDLDAMFKIKSLLYKDLILNSLSAMLMAMSKK